MQKFFVKNFCSEAPTTVSQNFVVILSYVVTVNLYIFASRPCVKKGWIISANSKYLPQNKVCSNSTNPNLLK